MGRAARIEPRDVEGLGIRGKAALLRGIENEAPVLLDGLKKVWCCSTLVNGKLALVNIVETVGS